MSARSGAIMANFFASNGTIRRNIREVSACPGNRITDSQDQRRASAVASHRLSRCAERSSYPRPERISCSLRSERKTRRARRAPCGYQTACRPGSSGPCPRVVSRLAKVSSGLGAAAARLAAHRALIASASWARRSGERLSVLFTLVRLAARRAAAARPASFLFAAASFAFTSASSLRFNLASFLGPSRSRVSSRRIFFLRVLAFIKERITSPTR